MRHGTMHILVVCTANLCRSPAMELFLRQGLGDLPGLDGTDVLVQSAGVAAEPGRPMPQRMVACLEKEGIHAPAWGARALDDDLLTSSNLVLTATREHRSAVVRHHPGALPYTWTMREFARYCEVAAPDAAELGRLSPAGRLHVTLERAQSARGDLVPEKVEDDDVDDPFGRSRRTYRACVREIQRCARSVLTVAGP